MSPEIAYIESYDYNLYLKNIFLAKPFIAPLFLNLPSTSYFNIPFVHLLNLPDQSTTIIANCILVVLELSAITWVFYKLRKKIIKDSLSLVVSLCILLSIASLYALSIVTEPITHIENTIWTFTSEPRYFALALVSFIVLIIRNFQFPKLRITHYFILAVVLLQTFRIHFYHFKTSQYNFNFSTYNLLQVDYKPTVDADYYLANNYTYVAAYASKGFKSIQLKPMRLSNTLDQLYNESERKLHICIIQLSGEDISEIKPVIESYNNKFDFSIVEK
jgi:hypothetical protein